MFAVRIENWVIVIASAVILSPYFVLASYCPVACIRGFCTTSGYCKCDPGFGGPSCDLERPPSYIERDKRTNHPKIILLRNSTTKEPRILRKSTCRCQNGGICDEDQQQCKCPPGWTGDVCANRCQPGRFGQNCTQACECFNGANCDHVSGDCICKPGFIGDKCLDPCPFDKFGVNCTETCSCGNEATCDKANGRCLCTPGWIGVVCNERQCPENKYGKDCVETCDCDKNNTESCHPHDGKCECKPGFNTTNCGYSDIRKTVTHFDVFWDEAFWIIFAIIFIVILAGIISVVYFSYRRRVKKLKAEITHASKYLAEECNHCDNFEYTLPRSVSSNAAKSVHEQAKKSSNMEHLSNDYEEPGLCVQTESDYISLIADHYESVDDHLYDVIKKNEILGAEYDHLDHSRPEQELHPNYDHTSSSKASTSKLQDSIKSNNVPPCSERVVCEDLKYYENPLYDFPKVTDL